MSPPRPAPSPIRTVPSAPEFHRIVLTRRRALARGLYRRSGLGRHHSPASPRPEGCASQRIADGMRCGKGGQFPDTSARIGVCVRSDCCPVIVCSSTQFRHDPTTPANTRLPCRTRQSSSSGARGHCSSARRRRGPGSEAGGGVTASARPAPGTRALAGRRRPAPRSSRPSPARSRGSPPGADRGGRPCRLGRGVVPPAVLYPGHERHRPGRAPAPSGQGGVEDGDVLAVVVRQHRGRDHRRLPCIALRGQRRARAGGPTPTAPSARATRRASFARGECKHVSSVSTLSQIR